MVKLDTWDSILEWSSEEHIIPYRSPIDNHLHRYFPDFFAKMKDKSGNIINMIIEVKPHKQIQEPKKQKRATKKYIREVMEYGVNQAKWKAAKLYCENKGWQFRVISEHDIFGTNK